MRKLLFIAFLIGAHSTEISSSHLSSNQHLRYDRDVETGPPAIVREYLQNLYNYRPQSAQLEDEPDYRSFDNNFTPIPDDAPTKAAVTAAAVADSGGQESRSRDNYNHYQPLPPSQPPRGLSGDNRRPFPPNPPYPRAGSRSRPPSFHDQDDNSHSPQLVNTFRDRVDESDYNFSDLPDDDEVETDPPILPNPRTYPNPNYNHRPPIRSNRPSQAKCGGGGGCGGGDGLPRPPGNLYDDQTGRERGEPSYRFGYDLHDQSRHENADRFGNVNGYFSFVDDEGTFNKVSYSAGAQKGFVVNNKVPADAPAPQPPQRTRAPHRRNPSDGGGSRRNSNVHASSYPPRPHHNPFGKHKSQSNRQNNHAPNNLNNNNNGQPSDDDQLLGAGLSVVVGASGGNNGKGNRGSGGGRGSDNWSRNKIANGSGVGSSTVVTTVSSVGDHGNNNNNISPQDPSDDQFGYVNGTSDGNETSNGAGEDGAKGSWGALGGRPNPNPNTRPRQRKRKPAYVVKVKRPANNGPAWQYYKPPNPGRPATGGGGGDQTSWQINNPPDNILSQPPVDLDGGIYDNDGSDSDFDPYPKDKSYSFGYKSGDSTRQEASDAYGNIRGSYSYVDPTGLTRVVHYTAGHSGFKVLNAQPSILHPVYADSPLTVQSLQSIPSIPIPVAVTSQLSQLRQPSAIVYHIHPDNGLGAEWKPWESSRVKGDMYNQNHRSRSNQLSPLISTNQSKRSRSHHRHRERSQKQMLQGNSFRLTHQNHRFFPAYSNIYEQNQSQNNNENFVSPTGDDIRSNPTFHVNPEEVETISSNVIHGLDNSADIEANQLYLKQLQRQQIRQQNKLRRLSQQYQQQIISTPAFQYSRRHQNQSPRYVPSSSSSHRYYYRDRLQQYPTNDENEILWTQQDQQYSDFEYPSPSVMTQSNVISVTVPTSNSSSNNINNNSSRSNTFISTVNPHSNRRRISSRERGQKRSREANGNKITRGDSKERAMSLKNTSMSSNNNVNNDNNNSSSNTMNITEIIINPVSAVAIGVIPTIEVIPSLPIPTPPMSMVMEREPDIKQYQGGYGDKNPLNAMSQSQSSESKSTISSGTRLQREIPLDRAHSVNSVTLALVPATETDMVAVPMPMIVTGSQMAESIMKSMIMSSSMVTSDPGSLELLKITSKEKKKSNDDINANFKVTEVPAKMEEMKPTSEAETTIIRMSPAARLAAKMASASPSSATSGKGAASISAITLPMSMSDSGMQVHYPEGRTESLNPSGGSSSKEMMTMTA